MKQMELCVIVEFHARPGREAALEAAIRKVVPPSRQEASCLAINAFRSKRNAALFFVISRWSDERAFDAHAGLAHTVEFLATAGPLLTHEVEAVRSSQIA